MISTKSGGYWATGIVLRYQDRGLVQAWSGSVDFYDDGYPKDDAGARQISTEGGLRTRSFVESYNVEIALAAVIDTLILDAGRLGIHFYNAGSKPALYYEDDGSSNDYPPPDGWRHMLRMQADRIGWDSYRVDVEAS